MALRDRWPSRTLFIYAAIGSAVGLGNIWRYPYLAYETVAEIANEAVYIKEIDSETAISNFIKATRKGV